LARRTDDRRALAGLLNNYAMVRGMTGAVTEALELATEGVRLADQSRDADLQVVSQIALIEAQWMAGWFRAIPSTIEEPLERTAGAARAPTGTGFDPYIWLVMHQAASAFEHGLSIVRERRTGLHWEASLLAQLAQAQLERGERDRARAAAEEAVRLAREQSTKAIECRAQPVYARVLRRTGGRASRGEIAAALAQARARVEETGATINAPFIHLELAELARLTGDIAACKHELHEAHRLFAEMGATARADDVARGITETSAG
jgi:hypothetical protein